MVVKEKGKFVTNQHERAGDFFFILRGEVNIEMPDWTVTLEPKELLVPQLTGTFYWNRSQGCSTETHAILCAGCGYF